MDPLGDRMKGYEAETKEFLPRKSFVVIRIDGKSFHSWTRGLQRPYDLRLNKAMAESTKALCKDFSGSVLAYTQSDEISIFLTDLTSDKAEPHLGGNIQKLVSIAASTITAEFNRFFLDRAPARFDARAFVLPSIVEVGNYFIWRQKDAQRNAISMLAEDMFSSKEIHGVSTADRREKLIASGLDFDAESPDFLNGTLIFRDNRKVLNPYMREGEPEFVVRKFWNARPAERFQIAESNSFFQIISS